MALEGWVSREVSGPATMPYPTTWPSGVTPSSLALSTDITTTAAPPSDICEALPAVMVPSLSNAGFRALSDSAVVPGRTPSSASKRSGSPLRWGTRTGTISSARRPSLAAAAAFSWLAAAKASWRSREMPTFWL